MLVLVHSAPVSLLRDHGRHRNLGVLSSPRCVYMDVGGWRWAADNDAYLAWDETRFRRMLDRIHGLPGCLFVTAPDDVGDSAATLERFEDWYDALVAVGQPLAFVLQDDATTDTVPWSRIDAVFVGGTTAFKMGTDAAGVVREAKARGKWVHMGRVNTRRRLRYAKALGCDSVDGTAFSMYRRTHLPWALRIAGGPTQMMLTDAAPEEGAER